MNENNPAANELLFKAGAAVADLRQQLAQSLAREEVLRTALEAVRAWNPPKVEYENAWVSMASVVGSNGVRDYFIRVAAAALKQTQAPLPGATNALNVVDAVCASTRCERSSDFTITLSFPSARTASVAARAIETLKQ